MTSPPSILENNCPGRAVAVCALDLIAGQRFSDSVLTVNRMLCALAYRPLPPLGRDSGLYKPRERTA